MLQLSDLIRGIDLQKLQENDGKFERATLRVGDTVSAGTTKPTPYIVPNKGVFLCMSLTGRFTTLTGVSTDGGVCQLKLSWLNGSNRVYIDDANPVYLDCLLTPGRVRSVGVTGDPSGQLAFPGLPWITFFQPSDSLSFKVQNEGAYANSWEIDMHGIFIRK